MQITMKTQGTQINVLRGTINGIGNNVKIMIDAFTKILADNVNAMRAVHAKDPEHYQLHQAALSTTRCFKELRLLPGASRSSEHY